ncbi:MAG: YcxB family protein [Clostridia bacterium]|nr:YcxB family protein [Clostridia bacterium]
MKPFESFGKLNKNDYAAFVRFGMLKGKYHRVYALLAALALTAGVIALALVGVARKNKEALICAGILLLCAGMLAYMIKTTVRNVMAKNEKAARGTQHVLFGKNGFVFELLYDKGSDSEYTDVLYEELERVYETKGHFIIYIDKRTAIIVPKRNLRVSPGSAREFLQKFIPDKFVICV